MANESLNAMEAYNNATNNTVEPLDCPDYSAETASAIESFAYWVEGVLLCTVAVPGIAGNAFSSYILSGKTMRNSFNILLIALAIFDNTYLFGSILESFRKRFQLYTNLHIILFPFFLYPIHMMAMTGSIVMTVAICLERYVAVHYPINYSRATNDAHALKRRVAKYLIPVTVVSVLFNITKFFEITYIYVPLNTSLSLPNPPPVNNLTYLIESEEVETHNTSIELLSINATKYRAVLNITEFRMDPNYSIYFNWTRFVTLGVIPFILLIFFNAQVYYDIRKRRKRKVARLATTRIGADSPSRMTTTVIKTEVPQSNSRPWHQKLVTSFQSKSKEACNEPPKSRTALLSIRIDEGQKNDFSDGEAASFTLQTNHLEKPTRFDNPIKLSTSNSEVRFCNGKRNSKELQVKSEEPDEQIQFGIAITTVNVDIHSDAGDSVQGAAKASPVSSAGLECSCGDSCACSSSESSEDRGEVAAMTTTSIACQTDHPAISSIEKRGHGFSPKIRRTSKKFQRNSGHETTIQVNFADDQRVKDEPEGERIPLVSSDTNLAAPAASTPVSPNCNSIAAVSGNNVTVSPVITTSRGTGNTPAVKPQRKNLNNNNVNNSNREGNLAAIMMGYVLVFLICHLPRLLLNIHELATIRNAMACGRAGQKPFHAWSIIVMHISHLLLVVNSSINILIYCFLSSKFREEGSLVLKSFWRFVSPQPTIRYGREVGIELTNVKATVTNMPRQSIYRLNH